MRINGHSEVQYTFNKLLLTYNPKKVSYKVKIIYLIIICAPRLDFGYASKSELSASGACG
jgi:hypothetical protein